MNCSVCEKLFFSSARISMVVCKTKIRKRSYFTICQNGHILLKQESDVAYYSYWYAHFMFDGMRLMNPESIK